MIVLGMITLLVLGGLLVGLVRLNRAVVDAHQRLRVLTGGYADARRLTEARRTFRRRQRAVETAVATGTQSLESVHQSLARRWRDGDRADGRSPRVYAGIRRLNRGVGRTISSLLAPRPGDDKNARQVRDEKE